ncbi:MAG: cation ABC transporter substrate-binding protein [candidate division Zixibacteria bacterium]|nr:cation ABC transporter substrate-binding protein [candidate division Zixibacteria bacterium]
MKKLITFLLILSFPICLHAAEKIRVFVGIPPLAYLAEEIGGDRVQCQVLLQPGESPHTFEPTPRQMIDLSRADYYFELGFPFESQITRKLGDGSGPEIIDITEGAKIRYMHSHHSDLGEPGNSEHNDPHVWLSPENIAAMARNMTDAFKKQNPADSNFYEHKLKNFLNDLDSIDQIIDSILEPYKGDSIMVFHPAFGYFTESYGLKQFAVETEGKSPGPKQIESIINEARKNNIRVIFVQPQFDPKSAQSIARAIEGGVVAIDPLERNLLANLLDIAHKIKDALK